MRRAVFSPRFIILVFAGLALAACLVGLGLAVAVDLPLRGFYPHWPLWAQILPGTPFPLATAIIAFWATRPASTTPK